MTRITEEAVCPPAEWMRFTNREGFDLHHQVGRLRFTNPTNTGESGNPGRSREINELWAALPKGPVRWWENATDFDLYKSASVWFVEDVTFQEAVHIFRALKRHELAKLMESTLTAPLLQMLHFGRLVRGLNPDQVNRLKYHLTKGLNYTEIRQRHEDPPSRTVFSSPAGELDSNQTYAIRRIQSNDKKRIIYEVKPEKELVQIIPVKANQNSRHFEVSLDEETAPRGRELRTALGQAFAIHDHWMHRNGGEVSIEHILLAVYRSGFEFEIRPGGHDFVEIDFSSPRPVIVIPLSRIPNSQSPLYEWQQRRLAADLVSEIQHLMLRTETDQVIEPMAFLRLVATFGLTKAMEELHEPFTSSTFDNEPSVFASAMLGVHDLLRAEHPELFEESRTPFDQVSFLQSDGGKPFMDLLFPESLWTEQRRSGIMDLDGVPIERRTNPLGARKGHTEPDRHLQLLREKALAEQVQVLGLFSSIRDEVRSALDNWRELHLDIPPELQQELIALKAQLAEIDQALRQADTSLLADGTTSTSLYVDIIVSRARDMGTLRHLKVTFDTINSRISSGAPPRVIPVLLRYALGGEPREEVGLLTNALVRLSVPEQSAFWQSLVWVRHWRVARRFIHFAFRYGLLEGGALRVLCLKAIEWNPIEENFLALRALLASLPMHQLSMVRLWLRDEASFLPMGKLAGDLASIAILERKIDAFENRIREFNGMSYAARLRRYLTLARAYRELDTSLFHVLADITDGVCEIEQARVAIDLLWSGKSGRASYSSLESLEDNVFLVDAAYQHTSLLIDDVTNRLIHRPLFQYALMAERVRLDVSYLKFLEWLDISDPQDFAIGKTRESLYRAEASRRKLQLDQEKSLGFWDESSTQPEGLVRKSKAGRLYLRGQIWKWFGFVNRGERLMQHAAFEIAPQNEVKFWMPIIRDLEEKYNRNMAHRMNEQIAVRAAMEEVRMTIGELAIDYAKGHGKKALVNRRWVDMDAAQKNGFMPREQLISLFEDIAEDILAEFNTCVISGDRFMSEILHRLVELCVELHKNHNKHNEYSDEGVPIGLIESNYRKNRRQEIVDSAA